MSGHWSGKLSADDKTLSGVWTQGVSAKPYYVYADPAHNQIYVGNQFQYDQYRDLRLAKNLAEEDLQDARLNAETGMGWEAWGPF